MGYLSCNADSSIATCDPYNWELHRKPKTIHKKPFKITHFSYSDLETATNSFSPTNFLGKGSHGSVFKASLHDGHLIAAVKKTTAPTTVDNEIEILSRVRSPRLVNILGFTSDSIGRKLIVVEYMPNGSLYDILHTNSKPPAWSTRVRFALQVAKAVQLLHLSNPPVIHRDIKSSNVLIDWENNARLGDFGLALRGHVEDVKIKCTPPAGTMGYLDPGYLAPGDLSAKSDVFSFGILLLEIISGRKAIDMKVSSVPSREVDGLNNKDQVGRSRSVGSGREIRSGPFDSNLDGDKQLGGVRSRRLGSGVKVPMVRLSTSRSMGILQSSKLVNDNGFVVQFVKNPNGKEKEEAKLLVINSEKRSPQ